MAIPKLKKQDIIDALKFIDTNGVPEHNTSIKYVLTSEDGKKYPPKYVIAVANHLANGADISTDSFGSGDARNLLETLGFAIETKQQEKYQLSITAESVTSTKGFPSAGPQKLSSKVPYRGVMCGSPFCSPVGALPAGPVFSCGRVFFFFIPYYTAPGQKSTAAAQAAVAHPRRLWYNPGSQPAQKAACKGACL